jgi:predicted transcriptional regulator
MMHKTITLRLDESKYNLIRKLAELENRPISNFIETATILYIQSLEFADELEMEEIRSNESLNKSLAAGMEDAKNGTGRFL